MIRVKRGHYEAFENTPPMVNGGCGSPHAKVDEVVEPTKLYSSPLKKSKFKSEENFVSKTKSSAFPSKKYDPKDIDVEKWFGYLPRARRKHHQMMGSMYTHSDMSFTLEDVKYIVNGALKDFEEELRREYDSILLDRLSEQWATFARYNEDCIQQKLKNSTFSYMS